MQPPYPDSGKFPNTFIVWNGVALSILITALLVFVGCRPDSGTGENGLSASGEGPSQEFIRLVNLGKSHYESGETEEALAAFQKALKMRPEQSEIYLNLANVHLLAGRPGEAIQAAEQALKLDQNLPAAHYAIGCAHIREGRHEEALKALQQALAFDPNIAAVHYQLGIAHQRLGHEEEAVRAFEETLLLNPDHPSANYNLSQVLRQQGHMDEASKALETHQAIQTTLTGPPPTEASYERSSYTEIQIPFQLEQPAVNGVQVSFQDVTQEMLENAEIYKGPFGVMDVNHRGATDLFVQEPGQGWRLLMNTNGVLAPVGQPLAGTEDAGYSKVLVADLQNDRVDDVLVLGTNTSHVFRFSTNGLAADATSFSGLKEVKAMDGGLWDLDFTGKLDLLVVSPAGEAKVYRNLGNMFFQDYTRPASIPSDLAGLHGLELDDWNNDDLADVLFLQAGVPPVLFSKIRGGELVRTNAPSSWPAFRSAKIGDMNNDLHVDLVGLNSSGELEIHWNGTEQKESVATDVPAAHHLLLVDYDNDGWLDILVAGERLRLWRNLGNAGFEEVTAATGLSELSFDRVIQVEAADLDNDCDQELILALANGGLKILRNNGANENQQMNLRLLGNRSNASGIGMRVEVVAGQWRTARTMKHPSMAIGIGDRTRVESLTVRWFDLDMNNTDIQVNNCEVITIAELQLPTGSCPYLYIWDGHRFRFISDILGSAPLGLPVAEGVLIEADPEEYVWMGDERSVQPHSGTYKVQVTEELREVLYLDEARLVVVDHPPGTEVVTTDKLRPGKPFPESELVTLRNPRPLQKATQLDGTEITERLLATDQVMVSPSQLRIPQLRGLAEPHGVVLDFGPLPTDQPLALVLTGWLRFGGGMANVAASHHKDLPFPFPQLEVETSEDHWQRVDVVAGAPSGKTKTILVDLDGKLPDGAKRLRLTAAFEIHWDRIALMEKWKHAPTKVVSLLPDRTDLHWRGFSEFEELPWYLPLTPAYDHVQQTPPWRITPSGWCTRYGAVDPLIASQDSALVLMNGGDELTLEWNHARLPKKPDGFQRGFFFYSVGWDKDADFHVVNGTTVEPLPWHGMNDQEYGEEKRPEDLPSGWIKEYNTRWVGGFTVRQ